MKNFFSRVFGTQQTPLRVCWWPADRRGRLYSSQARAWWHIDFLSKNFSDLSIRPYGHFGDVLILQKPVRRKVRDKLLPNMKNFSLVIFDLSDLVADLSEQDAKQGGFLTLGEFKDFSKHADFFVVNGLGLKGWVEKELCRPAFIIEDSYHLAYDPRLVKRHTRKELHPVWHGGGKQAAMFVEGFLNEADKMDLDASGKVGDYLGDVNNLLQHPVTIYSNRSYFDFSQHKSSIYKEHPQYPKLFKELLQYNVGVVPYWPWNKYCVGKSSNKADAMMLVGLPVIATPIPELERLITHTETGYLCTTKEQWQQAFEDLRDPETRKRIGMAGRSKIIEQRSVAFLASRWRRVLFEKDL